MNRKIDSEALRECLIDYFGSAMGVDFLMAISNVSEVQSASIQRLIETAEECGINTKDFEYDDNDMDR